MSNKITPHPEYPLNDYQLEALARLADTLPDMETVTGRFSGGKAIGVIPRKGNSKLFMDELSIVYDELPFIDREEYPHCRSVRIWDAVGFSPSIELHKRHPALLVADDWRRATTFDLYAMAIKTAASFVADLTIDHILTIKRYVEFMDDVKMVKFDDVTAPAEHFTTYVHNNDRDVYFKGHFGLDGLRLAVLRYLYPNPKGKKYGRQNPLFSTAGTRRDANGVYCVRISTAQGHVHRRGVCQ